MEKQLLLDIIHQIIGDRIQISEDRHIQAQYSQSRNSGWENLISRHPSYQSSLRQLKNDLQKAYAYLEHMSRFGNDLGIRTLQSGLFRAGYRPKESLVEEILIYIIVSRSITSSPENYYAETARTLLNELGYTDGLMDEKIKSLGAIELLEKILYLYVN